MYQLRNRSGERWAFETVEELVDALNASGALKADFRLVEVEEIEKPIGLTPLLSDHPAPKQRKPRAPKVEAPAETAPKEKRTRATKADESVIVSVLSMIPADGAQYKAVDIFRGKPTNGQAAAIKQLVADGRVVQHGKARGTTYSRAGAAS